MNWVSSRRSWRRFQIREERKRGGGPYPSPVLRTPRPFRGLAALLAAALFAVAAGPAAAAAVGMCVPDVRSHCDRSGLEAPPEAPPGQPACCISAPAAPHEAVVPAPPAPLDRLVAVLVERPGAPVVVGARPVVPPRDAGPPPPARRHLALSVLLV